MAKMHCPICNKVRDVSYGVQIRCDSCRNWSHVDNWTYTDAEWKKIQARNKRS